MAVGVGGEERVAGGGVEGEREAGGVGKGSMSGGGM